MGSFSIWHWLIVLVIVLLLFGSGKISGMMGDVAKGIKAFKKGMKEDDDDHPPVVHTEKVIDAKAKEKDHQPV